MNNSTATTVLATQKVFTLNHPKYLKSNRYRSIDNMEIEEVKNVRKKSIKSIYFCQQTLFTKKIVCRNLLLWQV